MKQTHKGRQFRKGLGSILYVSSLLFIGFLPKELPIAAHFPLDSPLNRLMLMMVISGLFWLFYASQNQPIMPNSPQKNKQKKLVKVERKNLQTRFLSALSSLKSMNIRTQFDDKDKSLPNQKLFDVPWVLMLGLPQSGKSSLLSRSGVKFLLSKKNNLATTVITRTQICEWWASPQAVILDTAGRYTKQEDNDSAHAVLWTDFLELLKQHRYPPLNALVITISLENLFSQTVVEQNDQIACIKKRINEIQKILNTTIPTYLVFTHADAVAGFTEFFDDLKQQERQQAWGICFTKNQIGTPQKISDTFDIEFEALLARLNERVIVRMHQEPHQRKRSLIKEFPLQMETVKRPVARVLNLLGAFLHLRQKTQLRGIFFTSTVAKSKVHDRLAVPLSKTFDIEPYVQRQAVRTRKSYFIKQFFDEFLFKDALNYHLKPVNDSYFKTFLKRGAIAASACAIVLGTFLWSHSIANNIVEIKKVEDFITRYQVLRENNKTPQADFTVPTMNLLSEINQVLANIELPLLLRVSIDRHYTLQGQAKQAYNKTVKKFVTKQLDLIIKTESAKGTAANTALLYGALKTYLSLADKNHYNTKYAYNWLMQNASNVNEPEGLKQHLALIHNPDFGFIHADLGLIQYARQTLSQAGQSQLALAILKNDLSQKLPVYQLNVPAEQGRLKIFANNRTYRIPAIFTAKYFSTTYEKLLPHAVNAALQGNWVTGRLPVQANVAMENLTEQTQDLYYGEYISTWENILANLQIVPFENMQQAIQLIDNLTQVDSPVSRLLHTIRANTNVTYHNIQTPVSIKFQRFNKIFTGNANPDLKSVQYHFQQMQDYLVNISSAQNPEYAAFRAAKARFMHEDKQDNFAILQQYSGLLPEPIDQWVAQVATSSWGLLLNMTHHYVNTQWQQKVFPFYEQKIKNHFPVDKTAKAELRVEDFSQFFGPAGIMENFYMATLAPFLDTVGKEWQWRVLDGQHLPASPAFLAQIQIANQIREAWFNDKSGSLQARFQVESTALQPIVKAFTLTMDGQRMVFKQNANLVSQYVWPGDQPLHSVVLNFSSFDGQQVTDSEAGLWAIFRLINKSVAQAAPNGKLQLTLDVNGYGARCELSGKSGVGINPFAPTLLPAFQLNQVV